MPTNVIYNVINHLVNSKGFVSELPAGVKVALLKNTHDNPYFLFQLPVPKEGVEFGEYALSDHHLTVNEDVLSVMGMKSQFHYTAELTDKSKTKFRLHVYFDALDGHMSRLFLDKAGADGTYSPVPCEEFHAMFSAFARDSVQNLLTYLRKSKDAVEREYLVKYMGLEKAATELSKNLNANKAAYLVKIDELIKALQELGVYSTKNVFISGNLSYLKRIRRVLADTAVVVAQATGSDTGPTDTKSNVETTEQVKKLGASATAEKPNKKTGLLAAIAKLQKSFAAIKTLKGGELVGALLVLFTDIIDMEFDIDAELYSATVSDIQELHQLKKDVEKYCTSLLLSKVFAGEFKAAKRLSQFHQLLATPNNLTGLIAKNNPRLLAFLIENKILPVDYNNIVIGDVRYDSLVAYYFKMAAPAAVSAATAAAPVAQASTASIVDCLDVLIKNGASLMGLDSGTGLPFAAVLLLDDKHPLRTVLNSNAALTINNELFCKQLSHLLRSLISQPHCSIGMKAKIKPLLMQMETQIIDAHMVKANPSLAKVQQGVAAVKDQIIAKFKEPVVERLLADPDYIALQQYVHRRLSALLPKLPKAERMGTNKWTQARKDIDAMLVEKSTIDITYEVYKDLAMEKQRKVLTSIDVRERLIEQQKEAQRPHANRKSMNKTNNKTRGILGEIAAMAYAEGAPDRELAKIDKKQTRAKEAIQSLNGAIEKLQNYQSVLTDLLSDLQAATSEQKKPKARKRNAFFPAAADTGTAVDGVDLTSSGTDLKHK